MIKSANDRLQNPQLSAGKWKPRRLCFIPSRTQSLLLCPVTESKWKLLIFTFTYFFTYLHVCSYLLPVVVQLCCPCFYLYFFWVKHRESNSLFVLTYSADSDSETSRFDPMCDIYCPEMNGVKRAVRFESSIFVGWSRRGPSCGFLMSEEVRVWSHNKHEKEAERQLPIKTDAQTEAPAGGTRLSTGSFNAKKKKNHLYNFSYWIIH